ncbi:MAG: transglutaminase domain-containing protein [Candidatus Bathyarchaeota archaeon]|nr:MAG: transglutaminase domain-containing protein [Candidatus Bathyarchaeota archaeon]
MKKLAIIAIIIVALIPLIIAPFTFRDQIQGFFSLLFGNSGDQDGQNNSGVILVDTSIPRVFNETSCFHNLTPNDPSVVDLRNEILQDPVAALTPDWMKFRDWVGNKIEYKSDSEIHGERDFWQFSNETIQLETGDCEDFSILLCSLLRSNGWETDSVYVIVGKQNEQYHAWVRLFWNDYQYNIEPQGSGFDMVLGDVTYLSGYKAVFYFNDQEFGTF